MEKRIFLAFLLSFLFLTVWSKIAAPPSLPTGKNLGAAPSLPQGVPSPEKTASLPPVLEKKINPEEKIQILENNKLKVEFTNIGGTIKQINIKEFNEKLPVVDIVTVEGLTDKVFSLESATGKRLIYSYRSDNDVVRKIYDLSESDYLIESVVEMSKVKKINMYTLDISRLDKIDDRDKSLFEYSIATSDKIIRKSNAFQFESKETKDNTSTLQWYGFRNRYFAFIVKPSFSLTSADSLFISQKSINFSVVPRETTDQLQFKEIIFCGPQNKELLKEYNYGFDRIIAYSGLGLIDGTAKILYSMLIFTQKIVHSWGLSIILLGIFVYLITYPLTMAGMSSMRKMQSLQPQMTKLREQHKSNPQKLNQEMMELYKKHKVNPMGGCLPMLVQMPVFIGLYQVLWRSVALKGKGFLWMKDLAEPDRIFLLNNHLPGIGNEINILPVLMCAVMAFQQKLSMKAMGTADPEQATQQKMMLIVLPIMMLFIFYKAASGLTLYFTISYLMTTFTQWKVSKLTI